MPSSIAPSVTEGIGQGVISDISQRQSSRPTSIHILDDDSLLNIFYLYRPAVTVADEDENFDDVKISITRGRRLDHKHAIWWYKPSHVCRRWRSLILGSASFLGVYLVCTLGTPVADMLERNLPTVPLVVDYLGGGHYITAKDEEGILLALGQPNRIRCIRVESSLDGMQQFVKVLYHELPILEYLVLVMTARGDDATFVFPKTIQAPRLHHLGLVRGPPIRSQLLTTASGLATLRLFMNHSPSFIHPNTLLQRISSLSQLETLEVITSPDRRAVEARLSHEPTTTHTTLPNLRLLSFKGICQYLEVLIRQIVTPRLEGLRVVLFEQPAFSIPCLVQFMNTTENETLRFDSVKLEISRRRVCMVTYLHEENRRCSFSISVTHTSSMAQFVDALGQVFSAVENLTLDYYVEDLRSPQEYFGIEVNPTVWRKLLRPFVCVKNFRVNHGMDEEFARSHNLGDVFNSFIDARQKGGLPVSFKLVGPSPNPGP